MGTGSARAAALGVGSGCIAVGAGLAGVFAFAGRVTVVFGGLLLFFAGYWLTQLGVVHHVTDGGFRSAARDLATPSPLPRLVLLVAGGYGIAYGVTLFTQTVLEPALVPAVLSGVASVAGYTVAHVGMKGDPVFT